MRTIIIFAGTTEGRKLAKACGNSGIRTIVSVASEYGEELIEKQPGIEILSGRLEIPQMERLLTKEKPEWVVDATHPHAVLVTENIRCACAHTGTSCLRLERRPAGGGEENAVYVDSIEEAARYLKTVEGNILITTGSKQLGAYTGCIPDMDRLYVRVLPSTEAIETCRSAGIKGKQIIAMQGPFQEELNRSIFRQFEINYLVTKEAGEQGGYQEKLRAAAKAGVIPVVVRRPKEEGGLPYRKVFQILGLKDERKRRITLVGVGVGNLNQLTGEGRQAIEKAEVIFGSERITESFAYLHKPMQPMYRSKPIRNYLEEHEEYKEIVVCLSGDVGFYSGAGDLLEEFSTEEVRVVCGISSLVYFAAALHKNWQDVKMLSAHGRTCNIEREVRHHEKVFALVGGSEGIRNFSKELKEADLTKVKLWVGSNLSYKNERIREGIPETFLDYNEAGLSVIWIENQEVSSLPVFSEIKDEDFIREKAPMTKQEVRTLSLGKLGLARNSVVYDIGAGTGSVSIACAGIASQGEVYAIERREENIPVIEGNKEKFKAEQVNIICGTAPEAFAPLPTPTHAFIGGSAGNMREIVTALLQKNPHIRVVINAILLETIGEAVNLLKKLPVTEVEITQVTVAKAKEIAACHMMMGNNPVSIISFTGGANE